MCLSSLGMAAILAFAFEALMCEFAGVVCTAFHVYLQVLLRCASTSAPLQTAWCNILHCQDFGCLLSGLPYTMFCLKGSLFITVFLLGLILALLTGVSGHGCLLMLHGFCSC